jgi:hypothetical protein
MGSTFIFEVKHSHSAISLTWSNEFKYCIYCSSAFKHKIESTAKVLVRLKGKMKRYIIGLKALIL